MPASRFMPFLQRFCQRVPVLRHFLGPCTLKLLKDIKCSLQGTWIKADCEPRKVCINTWVKIW